MRSTTCSSRPARCSALRDIRTALAAGRPAIEFIAPYQTVCNYTIYFIAPARASSSRRSRTVRRAAARCSCRASSCRAPSSRTATPPPKARARSTSRSIRTRSAPTDPLGNPLHRFYGTGPYPPAIDSQGNADCHAANIGWVKGPLNSRGRYPAGSYTGPGPLPGTTTGDSERRQLGGHRQRLPDRLRRHVRERGARDRQPGGRALAMALFRKRSAQHNGMSAFGAGLIAIVLVVVGTYFGFTKANPFADPYELQAVFDTVNNLKARSPVRVAGIEVGKVTKVEAIEEGDGAARVTMEIQDKALPIHEDAQIKIRPRIFLEGNFFVDLQPGSPTSPELADGETIPMSQTAAPVQFGDLLAALQSDTRTDLQVFLREYSSALEDGGAEGFNASIQYWEPAYRNTAIANQASLGQDPDKDLQRILENQAKLSRALVRDEASLQDLITNFNTFAGSLAREDSALAASLPALRDALRVGRPALESINSALPSLRAFARDALPGVRSSDDALAAARPFITQLRALFSPRGAARDRGGAARPDPQPRGVQPRVDPAARRGPPAVGLHEQRARALRGVAHHRPRLPRQLGPPRDRADAARVPESRRREPPFRRQQPAIPRRRGRAGDQRPPGAPRRRRLHAAAASPRRPVRDAGDPEPRRAGRPRGRVSVQRRREQSQANVAPARPISKAAFRDAVVKAKDYYVEATRVAEIHHLKALDALKQTGDGG